MQGTHVAVEDAEDVEDQDVLLALELLEDDTEADDVVFELEMLEDDDEEDAEVVTGAVG